MNEIVNRKPVLVVPYDPNWPKHFQKLKAHLWPAVSAFALTIEHVGSTAVSGLHAKPVIDIDIVIPDVKHLDLAKEALSKLGYEHRGNLGIENREAFRGNHPAQHAHNLYVCPKESIALRNHLCLRDTLRKDSRLRDAYARLKLSLAAKHPNSIDDYIEGKTEFILSILKKHGFGPDHLNDIRRANEAKPQVSRS